MRLLRRSVRPGSTRQVAAATECRAAVAVAAAAISLMVVQAAPPPRTATSRQGPVATAAQNALDTGDVKLVLPYVQASRGELTARRADDGDPQRSPEVKALADEYFWRLRFVCTVWARARRTPG